MSMGIKNGLSLHKIYHFMPKVALDQANNAGKGIN